MSIFWGIYAGQAAAAANRAQAEASSASARAARARTEIQALEARLDRTLLACEAMWTLLRNKLGIDEVELLDRINELDLSDGVLDGRKRKTAVACPSCGKTISRRFNRCMYCGQPVMHDPFA